MPKQPHTVTARGRMVRVELRDGTVFTARFRERTRSKLLIFEDGRRVPAGQVKAFSDRRLGQPIAKHRRIS